MAELIQSGIYLMIAGMGIVYVFLLMLILAINLMSVLVQRYFPDDTPLVRNLPTSIDKGTIAAIAAAIHQYRNKAR